MPKRRPDHVPMRTCAACREVHAKRSMVRLVRNADGTVTRDPTGKAPGRGTYICDRPDCREPRQLADAIQRALGVRPGPIDLEVNDAAT